MSPKTPKQDKPRSIIAEIAQSQLNSQLDEYEGLLPHNVNRLFFYIREQLKCPDFTVKIDKDRKEVFIEVRDTDGNVVNFKPKKAQHSLMVKFFDAPNYTVQFRGIE